MYKMTLNKQLDILEQMQGNGFNVCTCGRCGGVILFSPETKPSGIDETVVCPHCKSEMAYSDCPDFYYEGCSETTNEDYPFNEGDDYWTLEPYTNDEGDEGILAVQSCWDEESEVIFHENTASLYFDSLENVLKYCRDRYPFVKTSFFYAEYPDIKDGDCFVADEETGKFKLE